MRFLASAKQLVYLAKLALSAVAGNAVTETVSTEQAIESS